MSKLCTIKASEVDAMSKLCTIKASEAKTSHLHAVPTAAGR